jgi:RNA polymerase sigma-70 factor, ECF subfamily
VDEGELVAAAKEGEGEAFLRLVEVHQGQVRAFLRGLTGDRELAEDAAQETFLQAWQGLGGLRQEDRFSSWLYTIARRTALKHLRQRSWAIALDDAPPMEDRRAPDPVLRQDLDAALALLDPEQRAAFLLVPVFGLEYQEAAEVLGCPIGTVASRVARARVRLAAALATDEEEVTPR